MRKKKKFKWAPWFHTHSLMRTQVKCLWIYDIICDPPEPRCMLVHVNHSHCNDEWHSTLLNPPQTPAVCGRAAFGANEGFEEASRATLWSFLTDTSDRACMKSAGGHILTPTPPSCLYFQPNIYDQLYVNHSLIWKHVPAGKKMY